MAQFKAMNADVEVNGQTVISILEGMQTMRETGFSILRQCGIENPQEGEWYSQQSWLDAFKKIFEKCVYTVRW